MVGGSVKVFAAEATGPIKSKLHPRLSTSAKWIWVVYLVLTTACILSYKVCGMGWFDAFNYSMTSTATGGFSTESGSHRLLSTLLQKSMSVPYSVSSLVSTLLCCMLRPWGWTSRNL